MKKINLGFINLQQEVVYKYQLTQSIPEFYKVKLDKELNKYFSQIKIPDTKLFNTFKQDLTNSKQVIKLHTLTFKKFINLILSSHLNIFKGQLVENLFKAVVFSTYNLNKEHVFDILAQYIDKDLIPYYSKTIVKIVDYFDNNFNATFFNFIILILSSPFLSLEFLKNHFDYLVKYVLPFIEQNYEKLLNEVLQVLQILNINIKDFSYDQGFYMDTEFATDVSNFNISTPYLYDFKTYQNSKIDNTNNLHQLCWYTYILLNIKK